MSVTRILLLLLSAVTFLTGCSLMMDGLKWADPDGSTDADTDTDTDTDSDSDIDTDTDTDTDSDTDTDTGPGEWCDTDFGLCWENPPSSAATNQDGAVAYCVGLDSGGGDDWSIPNHYCPKQLFS